MTRNKLYIFLSVACAVGIIWLIVVYDHMASGFNEPGICLFKKLTGMPCPSCGSTRSVLSLFNGDITGALNWNPFGFLIMAALVVAPAWIFFDLITGKSTLYSSFIRVENILKRKWVAVSAVLIVLLNWIWNMYKGI